MLRRRPLLRAAAIGGGAYVAGKAKRRRSAERDYRGASQDARISEHERNQAAGGQYQQPAPTASQPAEASMSDQLARLSALHEQGALTDSEFAAAKSRLLGL
jgi:Short C-terminal domain